MTGLALPKRLTVTTLNAKLCARIGVRFNGEDCGTKCVSYDVEANTIVLRKDGKLEELTGKVEPYWRMIRSKRISS